MMESGYFNNWNFREYSYFAGGENFAVLKREFSVALLDNGRRILESRGVLHLRP